ncbi:NUMOD1 domain-containing DNA-binding protein [Acinetobacter sp.]|uniref:NUMOD1 domain-containing DNA-binding protein n=1 Tax=Acinetobacter sp. TaxID=472 RepID=UPI0038906222
MTRIVKPASCKWKKHYDLLIERGKNRSISGYTENHHIVPRCMGGEDEPENMVRLTAEEHYVAHQMLMKIYPQHHGIAKGAANLLMDSPTAPRKNKMYGWIKRRVAIANSAQMTEWHKNNVHPMLGKHHTDEARTKISKWQTNQPKKEAHYYSPASGEHLGSFKSVKDAANAFKIHPQTIYSCIRTPGKRSAGGFFWSYMLYDNLEITCQFTNGKPSLKKGKKIENRAKPIFWNSKWIKNSETQKCWKNADAIFAFWNSPTSSILKFCTENDFRNITVYRMIKEFKEGWNPFMDNEWLTWKKAQCHI